MSAETALEMATAIRKKLATDIGIGITGIAGPTGGTKKKPVGLVYIAIADRKLVVTERFLFKGAREIIRKKICQKALVLLRRFSAP